MYDRSRGSGDLSILNAALQQFVESEWKALDISLRAAIESLPADERRLAEKDLEELHATLEKIRPAFSQDYTKLALFTQRLYELAAFVGERLIAMRMAGSREQHILTGASAATELLLNAHLVGRLEQLALLYNVDLARITPALYAALWTYTQNNETALPDALSALKPPKKHRALTSDELEAISHVLIQALQQGKTHIAQVVSSYESNSRGLFSATASSPQTHSDTLRNEILGATLDTPPAIHTSTLVAFAASARGSDQEARIEGALDLLRSIASIARVRQYQQDGRWTSRATLLGTTLAGLRRLDAIVRNERYVHHVVENRWRMIERELRFLQQRNPKSAAALPLSDDIEAPEAFALYIQALAAHGTPLGVILAEIGDSAHLTFGPSEFRLFCRLATYAARKYAANLTTHESPKLRDLAESGLRGQQIVQILADLEFQLRRLESRTDAELLAWLTKEIQDRVREGVLRANEAEIGLDLANEMITRIRAGQEVRYITSLLALDGTIPTDIVRSYIGLPHTRRFALLSSPEIRFNNLYARNGQSLRELRQDAHARWIRYRQQAPMGSDVVPIRLRYTEDFDRATSATRRSGRRLFRKEFGDFLPDPDFEEMNDRDELQSPDVDSAAVTKPTKEKRVQRLGHRKT